jgi:hypothetical protein
MNLDIISVRRNRETNAAMKKAKFKNWMRTWLIRSLIRMSIRKNSPGIMLMCHRMVNIVMVKNPKDTCYRLENEVTGVQ